MDKIQQESLYYTMVLGRQFEMAAKEHYMQGHISGFLHLDIGQEGLSAAAMQAFDHGDVFTTYREHVMALARGMSAKSIMAELFGKETGVSKGRGGSMHLFDPSHFFYGGDAIVGGHIPNAVGCAYGRKLQKSENGVMVVFGDGATNQGVFYESLNNAATQKLPLIFLCENNQYAIGTHIGRVCPFTEMAKKAEPFMPTLSVDGMDPLAVYETVTEAKEYICKGHGPIFIEASTCRFEGHSMSDANRYRSPTEMDICKAQDPIERIKPFIDPAIEAALSAKAQAVVEEAVEFALNSPEPEVSTLMNDIFCKECGNVVS
jgi:pyruvate dehydrogenase E1 component alpha subunit